MRRSGEPVGTSGLTTPFTTSARFALVSYSSPSSSRSASFSTANMTTADVGTFGR